MRPYNPSKLLRERMGNALSARGAVAAFCRKTGIMRTTVDRWMNGENTPSVEALGKIAEGLGVEPWELLKPIQSQNVSASQDDLSPILTKIISKLKLLEPHELKAVEALIDGFIPLVPGRAAAARKQEDDQAP